MKTKGRSFTWPSKKDQWWVPTVSIICIITKLVASGHCVHGYKISDNEFQNVVEKFENISRSENTN